MKKSEALEKGVTELRKNLDRLEQFSVEFDAAIETCIEYLSEYRRGTQQRLQIEKEELYVSIEAAVQEATTCLDQGKEPVSALAQAL
jgi:hypothetical protein